MLQAKEGSISNTVKSAEITIASTSFLRPRDRALGQGGNNATRDMHCITLSLTLTNQSNLSIIIIIIVTTIITIIIIIIIIIRPSGVQFRE